MFPMTHIWFCKRVLGYLNSHTVLGSIFPDIAITKCLDYYDTHYVGWDSYKYIKASYPCCIDFAKAMCTHTVDPKGLDYYGDEAYADFEKGYCFQIGREIVDKVIDACNLPVEYGLWKAHNFIEMGIELNVLQDNPELKDILHKAFNDKEAIQEIAKPVSKLFKIDYNKVIDNIGEYSGFIELSHINSLTLSSKYDIQMKAKHGISVDIDKCADIIELSRGLVKDSFDEFINTCIGEISSMLERRSTEYE